MSEQAVKSNKTVKFVVTRQADPKTSSYTEEFELAYRPGMNVISALMEIQRNPVDSHGKETAPVCWESNCLEEVCGACSMVINGKPRQACAALVDKLELTDYDRADEHVPGSSGFGHRPQPDV